MSLMSIMKLSFKRLTYALGTPAATVQYPAVYRQPPHGTRVAIRNNFPDCIGCHDCEKKCPVQCIAILSENFIEGEKVPKSAKGMVFEKKVVSYKIDYSQCVNCGICIDICPTEALSFEKTFINPRQKIHLLNPDLVHKPRALRQEQGFEE